MFSKFYKLYKLPFLFLLPVLTSSAVFSKEVTKSEEILKPNVIIFYVDDLGWQDSQLNDIDDPTPFETPNMLALAEKGMNFTQGYSAAPTCAPSRAGLLSGQHPAKTQVTHVYGSSIPVAPKHRKLVSPYNYSYLQPEVLTLPEALRANGYKTGHVGKWHVGHYPEVGPLTAGFDFSYGGRGAHRNSKDRSKDFATRDANDKYKLSDEKYPPISEKHPDGISYPYDLVTENALNFVENNKAEPFFLYLAHWMVHYPTVTKNRDLLEYYTDKLGIDFPQDPNNITTPGQTNPYYGAMVTTVDWSLGRLMSLLESTDDPRHPGKKLIETTYVFLTSDNGGAEDRGTEIFTDNAPLDLGKKHAQEGGIRVPMVISGPKIKSGITNHNLINQLDYYPTILTLTQSTIDKVEANKLSGLDVTDVLIGKSEQVSDSKGKPRENLFWHFPHNSDNSMQSALREDDFKLYKNHIDGSYELYRLYTDGKRNDFEEQINLAGNKEYSVKLTDLIHQLEAQLAANNAQYPHLNATYKGDLPGLKQTPEFISNTFDKNKRIGTIKMQAGKTSFKQAYALGEVVARKLSTDANLGKMMTTYEKLPATISRDGLNVSAYIPEQYKKYLFVVIDSNNFIVTSEKYLSETLN